MSVEFIILFGGTYNLEFAGFHLAFWELFRWRMNARLQRAALEYGCLQSNTS